MKKCEKKAHQRPRQVCVKPPETSIVGVKCNPLQYTRDSLIPTQVNQMNQMNQQNNVMAVGRESADHDEQMFEASLYNDEFSESSEEMF